MSQQAVEQTLGRLITDKRFRRLAVESLKSACLREGYQLTPAEVLLVAKCLDLSGLNEFANGLDPGLRRSGPGSD